MNTQTRLIAALLVTFVLAMTACTQITRNASIQKETAPAINTINKPPGPEADPYLRHVPGSYDYENEMPPIELPFQ